MAARYTPIERLNISSVTSSTGQRSDEIPALLIRASIWPKRFSTAATTLRIINIGSKAFRLDAQLANERGGLACRTRIDVVHGNVETAPTKHKSRRLADSATSASD
ncbi:hypothetical protein AOQ71_36265 [Bradyrhizobium manausense]|uniref:Uncharacterized protein n=1 Tax=Bradyrhizobium manausense TaxID=989370 RepID=A0A0R3CWY3_9BRAD|nr:hypothetical protein AOQ71_36265 [Bradyrhizobium manausense]